MYDCDLPMASMMQLGVQILADKRLVKEDKYKWQIKFAQTA